MKLSAYSFNRKKPAFQKFYYWVLSKYPNFKIQLWEVFFIEEILNGKVDENGFLGYAYGSPDYSKTRIWKLWARYRREHELQAE